VIQRRIADAGSWLESCGSPLRNGHAIQFSYRSEHVADDTAVSVLTQAIRVVHLIREHGVA
jgi:hypothetical protein